MSRIIKYNTPDYPTIFSNLQAKISKENPSTGNDDNIKTAIDRYRPTNTSGPGNNNHGYRNTNNWDPRKVNISSTYHQAIKLNSNKIHTVGWNNDGTLLASGSMDRTASVAKIRPDSTQLVKIASCKGHSSKVDQVTFSPLHPEIFCTASFDKTVQMWDVRVKGCATTSSKEDDMTDESQPTRNENDNTEDLRGSSKRARLVVPDEREKSGSRDRRNDREGSNRRDKSQGRDNNNRDDDRNTKVNQNRKEKEKKGKAKKRKKKKKND